MKNIALAAASAAIGVLWLSTLAHAANRAALESEGWTVSAKTTVQGEFEGCDFDLPVPLDDGLVFVCSSYSYHYAFRPDFLVMVRDGSQKYLIDNEEFVGSLQRGVVIETYVVGEFHGCDFGKQIPLENGLIFECHIYKYHYAYHPAVIIFGSYVAIDGEKYDGVLYRP